MTETDALNWTEIEASLNSVGHADMGAVLSTETTARLIRDFEREDIYRSHIRMQRHGFGEGEYKYYAHPLPDPIRDLRRTLFPELARIANAWNARLGQAERFPEDHAAFLDICSANGQERPTPLILRYASGDYNCLHQDLYGDIWFPIQVVVLLSSEQDFTGGEFVMTEQRPRMQSRAEVVPLKQAHAVAFAVNDRPRQGKRGDYRVKQRHGVSTLRSGTRYTLGIIFHDAQ